MNTATNIHGITFTVGETIIRGLKPNEVTSKISEILWQNNIIDGKYIAIDFGSKPTSKREKYGYNRFNLKHK